MKIVAYDPYVQRRAGRRSWASSCSRLDELLAAERLHHRAPAQDPRDGRPDRRRGAAPGQAVGPHRQRRARRHRRRGRRWPRALKEGRVAGAGLDVYAKEPCTDSPLFELDQVVVTPHLGASTDEAQEKAGVAVARSVRLALAGELVPDAVNVQGGVIAEDVRPGIAAGREARPDLHRARRRGRPPSSTSRCSGEITQHDVKVLELAALKGVFADVVEEPVSYVNAPLLAQERGVEVRLTHRAESARTTATWSPLRGTLADGTEVVGLRHPDRPEARREARRRSTSYDLEVPLADHMAFFATPTAPASSAPSAGCSARPASTSPACRSRATDGRPGARRAHRRLRHPAGVLDRHRDRDRRQRRPGGRPRGGLSLARRREGPGDAPGPSARVRWEDHVVSAVGIPVPHSWTSH